VCVGFAGLAGSRAAAQSPSLTIDRSAGPARIGIQGEPAAYTLENSTNLASGPWDFLLTLPLTNSLQTWFDSASVLAPRRFYRARRLEALPVEYANDFRLIDHLAARARFIITMTTRMSGRSSWSSPATVARKSAT